LILDQLEEIAINFSRDCSLIAAWCDSKLAHEGARHMTLVCKPRHQCGIGRRPACGKVPPGKPHSELDEIGVRRCANFAKEPAHELKTADA